MSAYDKILNSKKIFLTGGTGSFRQGFFVGSALKDIWYTGFDHGIFS